MRLLIISNDKPQLEALSAGLKAAGIDCAAYSSPVSATFAFAFARPGFQAVIADFRMQGMNGPDMARVINNISPETPVMLMLDHEDLKSAGDMPGRGGWTALPKPVSIKKATAIARLLGDFSGMAAPIPA